MSEGELWCSGESDLPQLKSEQRRKRRSTAEPKNEAGRVRKGGAERTGRSAETEAPTRFNCVHLGF